MQFFVIGDESTVAGFGLVGVEGETVESADEAREALKRAFASPDIGIVVINERAAAGLREEMEKYTFGRSFPLIIEIPDRTGPMPGRVSIRQMVRSAVGISV
ncbi:MAG: Vacuolar H+transporting two-sector ATPase F subunit [Candidatus Latescibacterota bacterium]|jgi:V/A-type H+-transporting ATPase subunit F|nr:MAG: Vacuolar H+transporting two-sector ATPase F subunit [Candidatus Latescibacterota bacterium]